MNHVVLLRKLQYYRFRDKVIGWCKCYLNNRMVTTLANGTESSTMTVTCGVSQGSVLGPLFFIIYVNDTYKAVGRKGLQLYADDTVIHCRGNNALELEREMQGKLNRFSKWCKENKLTLNPSKTKLMVFGTRQRVNREYQQ